MTARRSCPPPELVQALHAGVLAPRLSEPVARHVEQCGVCRALAAALDDPSVAGLTEDEFARIRSAVHDKLARSRREILRARAWRWSAAAAVVLVAAIASVLIFQSRRTPLVTENVRPPDAPSVFQLDMPPVRNIAGADLARALAPYQAKDFREAARTLEAFTRQQPMDAAGQFYLGVTSLYVSRDAEAIRALEIAERLAPVQDPELRRDAMWYLALSYRRTGQVESARTRLSSLCADAGTLAPRACAGLRELSVPVHLFGATTDRGEPLAGVVVREHLVRSEGEIAVSFPAGLMATSDANGSYSASVTPLSTHATMILRASKPGYFSSTQGVRIAAEMQADFVLTRWIHIQLGHVIDGRTKIGDTSCTIQEPCQRFALVVPGNGTFVASVTSPTRQGVDLWVETPAGEIYSPRLQAPLRITIPVTAGSTYQVYVLTPADRPHEFELKTMITMGR